MNALRKRILVAAGVFVAVVLIIAGGLWYLGVERAMCYAYPWLPRKEVAGLMCLKLDMKHSITLAVKKDIPTSQVLELKSFIEQQTAVESVQYITAEQAWEDFKERNKDNVLILESLDRDFGGKNPLQGLLKIKISDSSQRASLIQAILDHDQLFIVERPPSGTEYRP